MIHLQIKESIIANPPKGERRKTTGPKSKRLDIGSQLPKAARTLNESRDYWEARFFDLFNSANRKRGKANQGKENKMNWLLSFMLRFSNVFAAIEKRERCWRLIAELLPHRPVVRKCQVSELRHKEYVILPLPRHPSVMQMAIGCPDCGCRSRIITVFVDREIRLPQTVCATQSAVCLANSDLNRDIPIHSTCLGCGNGLSAVLVPTEETA